MAPYGVVMRAGAAGESRNGRRAENGGLTFFPVPDVTRQTLPSVLRLLQSVWHAPCLIKGMTLFDELMQLAHVEPPWALNLVRIWFFAHRLSIDSGNGYATLHD